jgi:hypothetical protein
MRPNEAGNRVKKSPVRMQRMTPSDKITYGSNKPNLMADIDKFKQGAENAPQPPKQLWGSPAVKRRLAQRFAKKAKA